MKSSNRSVVIRSVRRIVPRSTGNATYMINGDQNLWLNQVEWNQLLSSGGLNRNTHTSAVVGCTMQYIEHNVEQGDLTAGTAKVKLAVPRRRSNGEMQSEVTFTTPGIKRTELSLILDGEFRSIAKSDALKQSEQPQITRQQPAAPVVDEEEFIEETKPETEEPEPDPAHQEEEAEVETPGM